MFHQLGTRIETSSFVSSSLSLVVQGSASPGSNCSFYGDVLAYKL